MLDVSRHGGIRCSFVYGKNGVFFGEQTKINHENTHEVPVKDKSEGSYIDHG
jgi:hypothetical protein